MKTYILQKDLPDVKAGVELKLSDNAGTIYRLVDKKPFNDMYAFPRDYVEKDDGTWFKLKEEPKTLKAKVVTSYWNIDLSEIVFLVRDYDEGEKAYTILPKRLAEILIAESKGLIAIISESNPNKISESDIVVGMRLKDKNDNEFIIKSVALDMTVFSNGFSMGKQDVAEFINNGTFKLAQ